MVCDNHGNPLGIVNVVRWVSYQHRHNGQTEKVTISLHKDVYKFVIILLNRRDELLMENT